MSLSRKIILSRKNPSDLYLWIALIIAFLVSLLVQWPRISDSYAIEDDFRNMYWMHLFDDADLFQAPDKFVDEWIVKLRMGDDSLIIFTGSPAYSIVYQIANRLIPFLLFSKFLIFPLTLIAVYYIFRIGEHLSDTRTALYLSLGFIVIALASTTTISTTAGLQRSFSLPILLAFIYYMMLDRDRAAIIVIFLAGIIYPPVFVLCAATYGLSLVEIPDREGITGKIRGISVNWRRAIPLMLVTFIVSIALTPMLISRRQPDRSFVPNDDKTYSADYSRVFWKATDGRHLLSDPYYRNGNPGELFVQFPFIGRAGLTLHGTSTIHLAVLFLLFILVWLLTGFKSAPIPHALRLFIAAVWLCFALSWLAILLTSSNLLYYPSRYTEAGLQLFFLIVVVLNLPSAVDRTVQLMRNPKFLFAVAVPVLLLSIALTLRLSSVESIDGQPDPSDFRIPIIALGVFLVLLTVAAGFRRENKNKSQNFENRKSKTVIKPVIVIIILIALSLYVVYFQPAFIVPTQSERELYRYLETLPAGSLLAGSETDKSNNFAMFAKRQMLVSCKDNTRDPLYENLRAIYARSNEIEEIVNFCGRCGVDYLIIDKKSYSEQALKEARLYYNDSYLADFIYSLDASSEFAMSGAPDSATVFQVGDISVIACDERLLEE